MIVRCARCQDPVSEEVGVEAPGEVGPIIFCSSACAEGTGRVEGEPAPLGALPLLPRRIAVAVDGSGPSSRAVEWAVALAASCGARIELVHAIDVSALRALDTLSSLPEVLRAGLERESMEPILREDAERRISREQRTCEEAGVESTTRISFEHPLKALREAADEADLVVIGSRGLGAVGGAILGSVSHRLSGETHTPILIIH